MTHKIPSTEEQIADILSEAAKGGKVGVTMRDCGVTMDEMEEALWALVGIDVADAARSLRKVMKKMKELRP